MTTCKASKKDPLDQAIQDHQDHPGEDSKSDHEHIWIRVGLVLASFHEVGAAGSIAEGEERNDADKKRNLYVPTIQMSRLKHVRGHVFTSRQE